MSARGARSRKVQQKEVEKKERKIGKTKATEPFREPHDAFAEWRATPTLNLTRSNTVGRTMTVSSNISRTTSHSNSTESSSHGTKASKARSNDSKDAQHTRTSKAAPPSSIITSISNTSSSKSKEKTTFQAKGKDTKAPRGRGGGVPIKKVVTTNLTQTFPQDDSAIFYAAPEGKTWMNFKIWDGKPGQSRPYGGFEYDEDLQSGSVLIYFKEEQVDEEHPIPSIRAELEVLENSGSTWLSNALLYGRIDDHEDDWALPASPDSLMPPEYHSGQRRMLGPTSMGGRSPPPFDIDQAYDGISTRAASRMQDFNNFASPSSAYRQPGQLAPTHKIWFTAPNNIKTLQGQRLHHVAIRNFIAMLHGKPIVGADFFDMLSTLQPEIEVMYDLESDGQGNITPREQSVNMIINYIKQHKLDDVRQSIKHALGLLAWSELDNIKWQHGYLEAYTHLAGVMTPQLEDVPDFKRLSVVTRRNLAIAAKTLQLRVMEAEERLSIFNFTDLWEDPIKASHSPVFQSYELFRQFLTNHYTRIYGNWPPVSNKTWLNRKVVLALQQDFGSLYDYLVDRDVIWNPREERASRKWEMAHQKNQDFTADVPELGMTDMLVTFDTKYGYAHIPHPFPMLPKNVSCMSKEKEKKSFFSALKKDKGKDTAQDAKAHLQLSIVFSDATNIEKLDMNFNGQSYATLTAEQTHLTTGAGSTLIDKFEQFELTTNLKQMTPREARLGRWVLLYGVLQVLSRLSVDVHGLKHTDGVRYLLCTDLKRCPEWVLGGQIDFFEPTQQHSWCWQRDWDSSVKRVAPVELDASSAVITPHSLTVPASPPLALSAQARPMSFMPIEHDPMFAASSRVDLQQDIDRIGEKIDNFTLAHALQRRRENEKAMAKDLGDWKPRLDSIGAATHVLPQHSHHLFPQTQIQPQGQPHPRSPPQQHPHVDVSHYNDVRLASSHPHSQVPPNLSVTDVDAEYPPPPPRNRAPVDSVNTDLGGYPFSGSTELPWTVPPGYDPRRASDTLGVWGVGFDARAVEEREREAAREGSGTIEGRERY